ncbi:pantoate--beta-alanine ligase [Candidatus Pantoea edessiphila]|uniref:Pantothenate synthetase n=1 Tax=Candidatus Pantoea edessiphila TaxID=2044610 RepID=A0A2P5SWC3_9GAMM|nr:pantoate--beta-alanine ligase [Candidatus Pantoea edessiphila]PPI86610.1 pantoate--beta-alanine ligase [Candidatus Pantoea edessiphila]
MFIIKDISQLNDQIKHWKKKNKIISLVPTMGNIHDGHLKLVREARKNSDILVVSIFINPMQFDNDNDLLNYPRTLSEDYKKLKKNLVNIVFVPKIIEIYPNGLKHQTFVQVPILSSMLEGINRPYHFQGVTTIVSKLFNLVQPNIAYFGEKDFQQLVIIRKMVIDMNFDIIIVGVPTVRNADGLALSSRNIHLNEKELKKATYLNKVIDYIANKLINDFKFNTIHTIDKANKILIHYGLKPDGLAICDEFTLQTLTLKRKSKNVVILAAAKIGNTRLIDCKKFIL